MKSRQENYEEYKKLFPDSVLIFRAGDVCEIYDDDAERVSKVCNIEYMFDFTSVVDEKDFKVITIKSETTERYVTNTLRHNGIRFNEVDITERYYALIVNSFSEGVQYVKEHTLKCCDIKAAQQWFNNAIDDCIGQNYYGHSNSNRQILRMESWSEGNALFCAFYKDYDDERVEIILQEVKAIPVVKTLETLKTLH